MAYESELMQIESAENQAKQARQQIAEQRKQAEQQRQQIQTQQRMITQPVKRVAFTPRQTREHQRQYLVSSGRDIGSLNKYGEGLTQYERETLTPYEASIASAKGQIQAAQKEEAAYNEAQRWISATRSGRAIPISSLPPEARRYAIDMASAEQAVNEQKKQVVDNLKEYQDFGKSLGLTLDKSGKNWVGTVPKTMSGEGSQTITIPFGQDLSGFAVAKGMANKDVNISFRKDNQIYFGNVSDYKKMAESAGLKQIDPRDISKGFTATIPSRMSGGVPKRVDISLEQIPNFVEVRNLQLKNIEQAKTKEFSYNISLPYQSRGTSFYSSEKGFYAPTTKIISTNPWTRIQSLSDQFFDTFGTKWAKEHLISQDYKDYQSWLQNWRGSLEAKQLYIDANGNSTKAMELWNQRKKTMLNEMATNYPYLSNVKMLSYPIALLNPPLGAVIGGVTSGTESYAKGGNVPLATIGGAGEAYLFGKIPRWGMESFDKLLVGGLYSRMKAGAMLTTLIASKPITQKLQQGWEAIPWQPTSNVGKFTKAALFYGGIERYVYPQMGFAYMTELAKSGFGKEEQMADTVWTYVRQNPAEFAGAVMGGKILAGAEFAGRFAKGEIINRLTNRPFLSEQFIDFNVRPRVAAEITIAGKEGRGFLLGKDVNSGKYNFLGGKVEQTGKYAKMNPVTFRKLLYEAVRGNREALQILKDNILKELKQEAGVLASDILSMRFKRFFASPGEMNYMWEIKLKPDVVLRAGSDVSKFKYFKGFEKSATPRVTMPHGTYTLRGIIRTDASYYIRVETILRRAAQDLFNSDGLLFSDLKLNKKWIVKFLRGEIRFVDLISNKEFVSAARKYLIEKGYRREEVGKLTSKEAVESYFLDKYKGGMKYPYVSTGKNQGILFGATSLYDRANQIRLTEITKKLVKYYGKKKLASFPVRGVEDILKLVPDITQSDIVLYKNFVRQVLSSKRTMITHLTSQPWEPMTFNELLKRERIVAKEFTTRASGGVKGTYVAPELYAKGEKGARGQIRGETLGYGGLTYLLPPGLSENVPIKFSLLPQPRTRPTVYYGKEKISAEAFKLKGKMSTADLVAYLEKRYGSVQGTLNSINHLESEFFLPDNTIMQVRSKGRFIISGYLGKLKKFEIVRVAKEVKARLVEDLKTIKNKKANVNERLNAAQRVGRLTGINHVSEISPSRYVRERVIEIPKPKFRASEEQTSRRTIELMLPRVRETPKPRIRELAKPRTKEAPTPRIREMPRFRIMELTPPRTRETPRPKITETPTPRITEVPRPKIISLLLPNREERRKRRVKKPIKKRVKSRTEPTVFEQLEFGRPSKGARAKIRIQGFEALRFRH